MRNLLVKISFILCTLLVLGSFSSRAWAWYSEVYTCTAYTYSISAHAGYTWVTVNGTSFDGTFTQDVSDNSSYSKTHTSVVPFVSAPSTVDVTAVMYAKPKGDYRFIGWYGNAEGSGTALSTSTSDNCKYTKTITAVKGNSNPARNFYAIFTKFKASTASIDFGNVAYNSAAQTRTFTIACDNVGNSWSQSGLSGVLSASLSNNKTDNSAHTCTVTITLNPTATGIVNQTLTITTPRGGTVSVTITANITETPIYAWNSLIWNADGSQKRTVYVDETINNVITSTSTGQIHYAIENWNPTGSNNEGATTPTFVDNTVVCGQAGTLTLRVTQDAEVGGYAAGNVTIALEINKYANALKTPFVAENNWMKPMYYSSEQTVRIQSDNTISPIEVEQYPGTAAIATYNNDSKVINTYGLTGVAKWTVSQAENYKYVAAVTKTMTVSVNPAPEAPDCYVLNETDEHNFFTTLDMTGHFGDDDVYAVDGPADQLYFDACKDLLGVNYFCAQYSTDNGNRWEDVDNPDLSNSWQSFGPYDLPTNTTHIRFGAKTGGTLTKYYKNVRVTRRTILSAEDLVVNRKIDGTPVYCGEEGSATLSINYSIANGGNIHIANDNPSKFALSTSEISVLDCSTGIAKVTITYFAKESGAGEDVAHFVIYNGVYSTEITVTGVTLKHDQLGEWHPHMEIMTLGTEIDNPFTATLSEIQGVTYTISSGSAVSFSGNTLTASALGSATVRAHVDGDATYNAIDSEITIEVTDKMVQYINWDQNLRHLHVGDANVVMTATAQSDLECETNGIRPIVYTVKDGSTSVVQIVNGNELKINGIGSVTIRASQAGGEDADGHDFISTFTEKEVFVRDPSDKCDVNIYEQDEEYRFDMGASAFKLNNSTLEIDFGGKEPESYTFKYKGEKKQGSVSGLFQKYLEGSMSVEQFVDGEWVLVENLGTPEENTYKTASQSLSHAATKMRIAVSNARGYHYFTDCVVKFAKYLEVWEGGSEKYTINFDALISSSDERTVTFKYSNISGPLVLTLSDGAPFTLSQTEIDGDCGDFGSASVKLTYVPTVEETGVAYTLTITDGEDLTTIITLATNASAEECVFQETATTEEWQTGTNWENSLIPTISRSAIIEHSVVIDHPVSAYKVTITKGAIVKIAPTGGLTIGAGGIHNATESNLILLADSTGARKGQTGYIRISPDCIDEMPRASVQMFSIGYYNKNSKAEDDNVAAWQYVGTPIDFNGALAKTVFKRSWIYSYNESSDRWENKRSELVMEPFKGYATTQYDKEQGMLLEFRGTLVPNRGVRTLDLIYAEASGGYNVIANSFAAPIDITKMRKTDFINVEPTIYLFHTGTHKQAEDQEGTYGDNAGQFMSISIGTATEMAEWFKDDDIPTTIAPMQGFGVYATGDGKPQVRLDYTKLVWNANYVAHPNQPLRIGKLRQEETDSIEEAEITATLKMSITADGWSDKCYLLESESYNASYEAGYDASKKESGKLNIFSLADDKPLAINATNSIIGTHVGVRTGDEMIYIISFSHLRSEEELSLIDNETNQKIDINEGTHYPFYAMPNSVITDRFQIVARNDAPSITTGIDEVTNETKAYKFIKDGQMYILKNGVLYNAMGGIVR